MGKLAVLRTRVKRYRSLGRSQDKLQSPTLKKALEFLDDRMLPATSNTVERDNRRHRKMQKSVCRVRTKGNVTGRHALDLVGMIANPRPERERVFEGLPGSGLVCLTTANQPARSKTSRQVQASGNEG